MKLNTICRKAETLGFSARVDKMCGGGLRLFISFYRDVDGRAVMVDRVTEGALYKYLSRIKARFEYNAGYNGIYIEEGAK